MEAPRVTNLNNPTLCRLCGHQCRTHKDHVAHFAAYHPHEKAYACPECQWCQSMHHNQLLRHLREGCRVVQARIQAHNDRKRVEDRARMLEEEEARKVKEEARKSARKRMLRAEARRLRVQLNKLATRLVEVEEKLQHSDAEDYENEVDGAGGLDWELSNQETSEQVDGAENMDTENDDDDDDDEEESEEEDE